jgi:hypothetical protein
MDRNDLLIGEKDGGSSGQISALRASGRREARAIVAAGGATQAQFKAADKLGFASAAQRRTAGAASAAAGGSRRATASR